MAISFPRSLPSTPELRSIDIGYRSYVGVSSSIFSPAIQVHDFQAARWQWVCELPPMKRDDAEEWTGWLISMQGPLGTFLLGDPQGATPRGVATGTPVISGAHVTGLTELATSGWTASQTGILKSGDWIQLGTGITARLYKIMQSTDSDGGGLATLDVFPPLKDALSGGESITTASCKGVFRLSDDEQTYSVDYTTLFGISFTAVEVA